MPMISRKDGNIDFIPEAELAIGHKYATALEAKLAMVRWIDALTDQIERQTARVIRTLWTDEERMAKAYLATPSTATVEDVATLEIDGLAKARTAQQQAEKILEKAVYYHAIGKEIRALFLATEHQLDQATDPAQYEAILDAAKATATPIAAAYGLTV